MKINWLVRIKNKNFWVAFVPTALLLIQAVASLFGYTIDLGDLGNKLLNVIELAFILLAILGVVTDHTTAGISDSEQALTYDKPKQ